MRVLVCGDRGWTDGDLVLTALSALLVGRLAAEVTVVHGAARGADSLAARVAEELGMGVEAHPADWAGYGRAAGPIRNAEMLRSGVDLVIAFHDDLGRSRGTADTVRRAALKAGLPVWVIGATRQAWLKPEGSPVGLLVLREAGPLGELEGLS